MNSTHRFKIGLEIVEGFSMVDSFGIKIGLGLAFVLVVGVLFYLTHMTFYPETGIHTGYVTESGFGGLFFQNYYVKVVSANFAYGDKDAAWVYGIDKTNPNANELFEKIRTFQQNHSLVSVSYSCDMFVFAWVADSSCRIKDMTQVVVE